LALFGLCPSLPPVFGEPRSRPLAGRFFLVPFGFACAFPFEFTGGRSPPTILGLACVFLCLLRPLRTPTTQIVCWSFRSGPASGCVQSGFPAFFTCVPDFFYLAFNFSAGVSVPFLRLLFCYPPFDGASAFFWKLWAISFPPFPGLVFLLADPSFPFEELSPVCYISQRFLYPIPMELVRLFNSSLLGSLSTCRDWVFRFTWVSLPFF